jgi:N6-adenosine-specific RNA methylase IME4
MNDAQPETSDSQGYGAIVIDPPWTYAMDKPQTGKADRKAGAGHFYPLMSHAEIAALPVSDLAAPNAHLYLWVTNPLMFEERDGWTPLRMVESWGFTYKTLITWYKTGPTGLGYYFRGRTEHALFAVRGKAPIPPTKREQNILLATNGKHSAKPESFYDLVERVSPAPRLEMFARRNRLDWHTWGNESLEHVAI